MARRDLTLEEQGHVRTCRCSAPASATGAAWSGSCGAKGDARRGRGWARWAAGASRCAG